MFVVATQTFIKKITRAHMKVWMYIQREKLVICGRVRHLRGVLACLHVHLCVINAPLCLWLPFEGVSLWSEMKGQTQMLILAQPPVVSRRSVARQQTTECRHSLLPRRWLATPHIQKPFPTSCFYLLKHSQRCQGNDPVSGVQYLMRTIRAAPTYWLWVILWTTQVHPNMQHCLNEG